MVSNKIAIIGFGKIGSAVLESLEINGEYLRKKTGADIKVEAILDIRDFSYHPKKHLFVNGIDEIVDNTEIFCVVETIGGIEPAFSFIKKCLNAKKNVVTANKELIATHGSELLLIAEENGVNILFEASVGGAAPVINTMTGALAANKIEKIEGILNGTTNFILSRMYSERLTFDEALDEAVKRGYAEPQDPSEDIDGLDAQRKIGILTSIASGCYMNLDFIPTRGISTVTNTDLMLAKLSNGTIKLIASAEIGDNGESTASVSPMFVSNEDEFSKVSDSYNMIRFSCNLADRIEVFGRGAGRLPTSGAILSDIVEIIIKKQNRKPLWRRTGAEKKNISSKKHDYFATSISSNKEKILEMFRVVSISEPIDDRISYFLSEYTEHEMKELALALLLDGINMSVYRVF